MILSKVNKVLGSKEYSIDLKDAMRFPKSDVPERAGPEIKIKFLAMVEASVETSYGTTRLKYRDFTTTS